MVVFSSERQPIFFVSAQDNEGPSRQWRSLNSPKEGPPFRARSGVRSCARSGVRSSVRSACVRSSVRSACVRSGVRSGVRKVVY